MKKISAVLVAFLLFTINTMPIFAAETSQSDQDLSVVIISPSSIESKPVCEETIEFTVTNESNHTINNIACYLMILDKGRGQTYPVDEFGQEAYQTREITSLASGDSITMEIPVKITYVGDFKFNICVIEYGNDQVYVSNMLSVHMIENSSMNKGMVMVVAGIVPVLTLAGVMIFGKKKQ